MLIDFIIQLRLEEALVFYHRALRGAGPTGVNSVSLASDDENTKNRQNKSENTIFIKKVLKCDRSGEAGRRELGDGVRRCEDAVLATLLVWRPKLCC